MRDIVERVGAYLMLGGLFNPELAEHDAVRDLVMDCRDEITRLRAEVASLTKECGMGMLEIANCRSEIDRLRADVERKDAALSVLSDHWKHGYGGPTRADIIRAVEDISKAALTAQEKTDE